MITINGHIVGMTHHAGAAECLAEMPDNAALWLRREPENPHDPNAVAVYDTFNERKLGYIVRAQAAKLAPIMDAQRQDQVRARYDKGDGHTPVAHVELPDMPT